MQSPVLEASRFSNVVVGANSIAYGSGLEGVVVKRPTSFFVEARNRNNVKINKGGASCEVSVTRLNGKLLANVVDKNNGTYEASFTPDVPGDYKIDVLLNGQPVKGSPFTTQVYIESALYRVKCILQVYGKKKIESEPQNVFVTVVGPNNKLLDVHLDYIGNGNFQVVYVPTEIGDYVLDGYMNGKRVEGCPYVVTYKGSKQAAIVDPTRSVAYGPGVQDAIFTDDLYFTVEARNADDVPTGKGGGDCQVSITGPSKHVSATIIDNGDGTYTVRYAPKETGKHKIQVTLDGEETLKSPFLIQIEPRQEIETVITPSQGDQDSIIDKGIVKQEPIEYQAKVTGRGVQMAVVGTDPVFTVETFDQYGEKAILDDPEKLKVVVTTARGKQVPVKIAEFPDGKFQVSYHPDELGPLTIDIKLEGKSVSGFPRQVVVEKDAIAYGPGLEEASCDGPATFIVEAFGSDGKRKPGGGDDCRVSVTGPNGKVKTSVKDNADGTYSVEYQPIQPGDHFIDATFNGRTVVNSPFSVYVSPTNFKISCSGPGVQDAIVQSLTEFYLDFEEGDSEEVTRLNKDRLKVNITGPNGRPVESRINAKANGRYVIEYQPEVPGEHDVDILIDNVSIDGCPFKVMARAKPREIKPESDPSKTIAYGPGLEGATSGQPTHLTVEVHDTKGNRVNHGGERIQAVITGPKGPVSANVSDNKDGTYKVDYTPQKPGFYRIDLKLKDTSIAKSPFSVTCVRQGADPSKSIAYGRGLENALGTPQSQFCVEARDSKGKRLKTGGDDVQISINGPKGIIPATVTDGNNGIYSVDYTPKGLGKYNVEVAVNGKQIPQSPFHVEFKKPEYQPKCHGSGLQDVTVNEPALFFVDPGSDEPQYSEHEANLIEILIRSPTGETVESACKQNSDGTFSVEWTPTKIGQYKVNVLVDGKPVPGAPFAVNARSQVDPSKTVAYGPGAETAVAGSPARFTVEARDAQGNCLTNGGEKVNVKMRGPKGVVQTSVVDNGNGTYAVEYVPPDAGDYQYEIELNDQLVQPTPRLLKVVPPTYSVKCSGPGVTQATAGDPADFDIEFYDPAGKKALNVDPSKVDVQVNGAKGPLKTNVAKNPDGTFTANYTPPAIGKYAVNVLYDKKPLKTYDVPAVSKADPSRSTASGPGLENNPKEPVFIVQARDSEGQPVKIGGDQVEVLVTSPEGKVTPGIVEDKGNGTYAVQYALPIPGQTKLDINLNGKPVARSPYHVNVDKPQLDIKCTGRGVLGGVINPKADFAIRGFKKETGEQVPLKPESAKIEVLGPSGSPQNLASVTKAEDGSLIASYKATQPGSYKVSIEYDNNPAPSFPRTVNFGAKGSTISGSMLRADQNVQLQKDDDIFFPEGLRMVTFGLGWSTKEEADLDASCVLLRYTRKLDHAFFKATKTLDGAVVHSGDNRVGGDGVLDDEQIVVDLLKVNPKVNTLMFIVNVFDEDKTFTSVASAYVRLRNDKTGKELARYTLTNCGNRTALIMCKIYRFGPSQWRLKIIGESADGHTYDKTLKDTLPYLERLPPMRALEVKVHEARNLPDQLGVINPYVELRYDTDRERTKVVKTTLSPKWEQSLKLKGEAIHLEANILDKQTSGNQLQIFASGKQSDQLLGRTTVFLDVNEKVNIEPSWYPIMLDAQKQLGKAELKLSIVQLS